MALTYRGAGVDIDAGDALVERIKPLAKRTRIPEVISDVGGFAGLCALPLGVDDPVLVSGTDGVGTKLKVAFLSGRHGTVGEDLVAMCVNDVVTTGARPLFFLDYFATGKLSVDDAAQVIGGVARGCELAGCALLGGETAELPGFYADGEYDLAGFAVGVVARKKLLDGRSVRAGDVAIGVASSGLHSNGYSLARKVLLEHAALPLDGYVHALGEPLVDALMRPTRIYARAVAGALVAGEVTSIAHITGGGLSGNAPRVLPDGVALELDAAAWTVPPILELVRALGEVAADEMERTFNMGLGLVVTTRAEDADAVMRAIQEAGETCTVVGRVTPSEGAARVRYVGDRLP